MRIFFEKLKSGVYQGIGIILVMGLTGVAYGAYVSMSDVTNGDPLTASTFNQVLENIRVLKTTVDGIGNGVIPVGFVGAFNGTSCPSGWTAADGSGDEKNTSGVNTTLDLRGEFIRGLDSGRGVDSGRVLGTGQIGTHTLLDDDASLYSPPLGISSTSQLNTLGYEPATLAGNVTFSVATTGSNGTTNSYNVVTRTSRPRNVALLYCVKQ